MFKGSYGTSGIKYIFFFSSVLNSVKQWQRDFVQFNVQKDYLDIYQGSILWKSVSKNFLRKDKGEKYLGKA